MEEFGDQLFLFDLDHNIPYVLNKVAAFILLNSEGQEDCETITGRVCEKFDVEFQQALSDVKIIIDEFIQKKIIRKTD